MNTPDSEHYVARLVVEKVNVSQPGQPNQKRNTQEMGSFTVKDKDLKRLLDKVSAHASLIGD